MVVSADIPLIGGGLISEAPNDYGYEGTQGLIIPTGVGAQVTLRPWRPFEIGLRGDYRSRRRTHCSTNARTHGWEAPTVRRVRVSLTSIASAGTLWSCLSLMNLLDASRECHG